MRHSKRDYLRTDDIKFAMEKLSVNVSRLIHLFNYYLIRVFMGIHHPFPLAMKRFRTLKICGTSNHKYVFKNLLISIHRL